MKSSVITVRFFMHFANGAGEGGFIALEPAAGQIPSAADIRFGFAHHQQALSVVDSDACGRVSTYCWSGVRKCDLK